MTTTDSAPSGASTTKPTTVLVAGATGWLGSKIVREISATGAITRVGLRGGTAHEKADELARLDNVEIVELDLARPDTMPAAVEGVDVIVSAVQGGPDLLVEGQAALAAAAVEAGVRRIFPSDFGVDATNIPEKDHLFFAWRTQAQHAIAATGLAQTNTYNGAFMEMLMPQPILVIVDWEGSRINYWGDPDQVYDFTETDDVARFVAAASIDPDIADGAFRVAGDSVSPTMLAERAEKATGRHFELVKLGTLDDLDAEIARRQADAPDDPMAWIGLQYFRTMASGVGQLTHTDNSRYASVTPTRTEPFLTRNAPTVD